MRYIQLAGAKLRRILQPAKDLRMFLCRWSYFTTTLFTLHSGAASVVLVYWNAM